MAQPGIALIKVHRGSKLDKHSTFVITQLIDLLKSEVHSSSAFKFAELVKSLHSAFVHTESVTDSYRVTMQLVPNLPLPSKHKFCFSMRPMY